jgi:hypothetical protein
MGLDFNPDELFEAVNRVNEKTGYLPLSRTTFDNILRFNELCEKLVEQSSGDYEFPFVYLTSKLFNRLPPEGQAFFLEEFEKELS